MMSGHRRLKAIAALALLGALCSCDVTLPISSGSSSAVSPPEHAGPLIVQVENAPEARPQSGLQSARIVYEYVAEGGVSRFSAIFPDVPAVRVGPVRSARIATIALLDLYRGLLVYSGASTYINGQLSATGLPHVDEDHGGGDLFRTRDRFPPHNLYVDGAHLHDLVSREAPPAITYGFPAATSALSGGSSAVRIVVPVSTFEVPVFRWDAARKGYVRYESTGVLVDRNSGGPVVADTVIVQQVPVVPAPEVVDVNGVIGVRHTLTGSGAAQVFSAGHEVDATWTQPTVGPPSFVLANGQAAPWGSGLVWICLVPTGAKATFT